VAGLLFAIFVLNALFGSALMNGVMGIADLAGGVWLIGFRPISRTNPRFRLVDVALGLLLLVGAWRMLGNWPR
jgi:hypothetical protein